MTAPTLLTLPLELRLQIYAHALRCSPATLTISTACLSGSNAERTQRLHDEQRTPFHGIPQGQIPVIEPRYDASLLSITRPGMVSASTRPKPEETGVCDYSPKPPLLLVNKQVYAELNEHIPSVRERGLSLFIAYPYGLHVFASMASHLLPCTKTVVIVGQYNSLSFNSARAAKLPSTVGPETSIDAAYPDMSMPLAALISDLLGRTPRIDQLHLRIFYPGSNSYSTVWGDNLSPTVIALRNIFAGDIKIEVSRGLKGTGVFLAARPSSDGKRSVSTVWRPLHEGKSGEKEVGSWTVDEAWPDVIDWEDSSNDSAYQGVKDLISL